MRSTKVAITEKLLKVFALQCSPVLHWLCPVSGMSYRRLLRILTEAKELKRAPKARKDHTLKGLSQGFVLKL